MKSTALSAPIELGERIRSDRETVSTEKVGPTGPGKTILAKSYEGPDRIGVSFTGERTKPFHFFFAFPPLWAFPDRKTIYHAQNLSINRASVETLRSRYPPAPQTLFRTTLCGNTFLFDCRGMSP